MDRGFRLASWNTNLIHRSTYTDPLPGRPDFVVARHSTLVWYLNEQVPQIRPFRDWPQVMAKAEELRERLMQPPD